MGGRRTRGGVTRARPFVDLLPDLRRGHEVMGETLAGSREARSGARGDPLPGHVVATRGLRLQAIRDFQLRPPGPRVPAQSQYMADARVGGAWTIRRLATRRLARQQRRRFG